MMQIQWTLRSKHMVSRACMIVGLVVLMIAVLGSGLGARRLAYAQGGSPPPGLVLWNQLGRDEEVLNSAFGPDLAFYQDGDCVEDCVGVEHKANPAYVPGVFGKAV